MIIGREHAENWPDMLGGCCIVCGRYRGYKSHVGGAHHEPPKGTGGEKAWKGALLSLCGSGTTGCHGLRHAGKLEFQYDDQSGWMWRGENSHGIRVNEWVYCRDDDYWNTLRGF